MHKIAALYKFTTVSDPQLLQSQLRDRAQELDISGTLIVSFEGINGTISGEPLALDRMVAFLQGFEGFEELEIKFAQSDEKPFKRLKVRFKKEIVTMGVDEIDPVAHRGRYVEPENWNDLIRRNDVVLIDTRNDYEVGIGTFSRALDPNITTFREFPNWWDAHKEEFQGKKIAMFCTGGIRCEKSTAYLRSQGVEDVFHLKGGILQYLEDVNESESLWDGECFVFDERVSVGHGLQQGDYSICFGCRRPLSPEDLKSHMFELGVSCPKCYETTSQADKARFRERQRQNEIQQKRAANER